MENTFFENRLAELCGADRVQRSVPMSEHTTFRTGGPADHYVRPADREAFLRVLRYLRQSEREYLILGKGSNLLVGDKGYRGTVVDTSEALNETEIDGDTVTAGAGVGLSTVAGMAAEAALTGMEFASGIPGSVGGAVFMNAGAYGGEMSQIVKSVEVVDPSEEVIEIQGSDMGFRYRMSIAQEKKLPILSVKLGLSHGEKDEIYARIKDLGMQRAKKQPLEFASAGSTFKRPEGYYAGKLITDTGLSGLTIGGARVSPKHNGFIINLGNATSADILDLIDEVRERVKARFGVELVPEVRIIGDF
ncbi:MAG: UDP-N-acetylmuramate dehydrogenase [Lachnospiraceae bacterium]|nr:UDP-N-acetylmuramate dehydrogenase [Lachnospiraceae bacterium]